MISLALRGDLDRADARAVAGLTGAFVNLDPVYLQSAGFVLDPAGKVVHAGSRKSAP